MAAELRFRAMGTDVHLIAVGGDEHVLEAARDRIDGLEAIWSRFRDTSEISRLNAAHGKPVIVSPETIQLIARAIEGWRATAGMFDPTILDALIEIGYDRTFDELVASDEPVAPGAGSRGCGDIVIDEIVGAVSLPARTAFDPGGIGKGLAADIVAGQMLDAGARGACVNLGGDLRVRGEPPDADGWVVEVEHPITGDRLDVIALEEGAVCTSSRMKRAWRRGAQRMHHLIDPRTARPARTGVAAVTVVAAEAWWAEVAAKAAFMAGASQAQVMLSSLGVAGIVVESNGDVTRTRAPA